METAWNIVGMVCVASVSMVFIAITCALVWGK